MQQSNKIQIFVCRVRTFVACIVFASGQKRWTNRGSSPSELVDDSTGLAAKLQSSWLIRFNLVGSLYVCPCFCLFYCFVLDTENVIFPTGKEIHPISLACVCPGTAFQNALDLVADWLNMQKFISFDTFSKKNEHVSIHEQLCVRQREETVLETESIEDNEDAKFRKYVNFPKDHSALLDAVSQSYH